jgi:hypothetical protein
MEYKNLYNNLIHLFPNNELLDNIKNEDVTQYNIRINNLIKSLKNQVNFNNFAKSKIKVFSHKEADTTQISESLFGKTLTLKKIFNNQNDTIKNLLWNNLHKMVLYELEEQNKTLQDKNIEERINKLKLNFKFKDPKQTFKSLLKTENLNNSTNNLINDIFSSFEESMTEKNPLNNLLNISSLISEKYKDKIDNGEIDLNSLLTGLQSNLPGMDGIKTLIEPLMNMTKTEEVKETIIMDENFSTANVSIGKEEEAQPVLGEGMGKLFNTLSSLRLDDPNLQDTLKNNLGLDMNLISEQMNKILQEQNKLN